MTKFYFNWSTGNLIFIKDKGIKWDLYNSGYIKISYLAIFFLYLKIKFNRL